MYRKTLTILEKTIMPKFELDNQMLKKLETLAKLTMILNTSEKTTKAQIQIGHTRVILSVQIPSEWESFPLYTYQRSYVNLTYADLDGAIEEMNQIIKYAI